MNDICIGPQWCQKWTRNQMTQLIVLCDFLVGRLGANHLISDTFPHLSNEDSRPLVLMTFKILSTFKTPGQKPSILTWMQSLTCTRALGKSPFFSEPQFPIFKMKIKIPTLYFSKGIKIILFGCKDVKVLFICRILLLL